jgi:branched-chain amino acid transport system permease protein
MGKRNYHSLFIILGIGAVLAALPLGIRKEFLISIFINIFLYAYLGQCWNILGGYAGYLSLGHTVFFGIGAYVSSLLFCWIGLSPWLGMIAGAAVAMAVGTFISYLSFRYGLRGIYFAMITLAFGVIFRVIFNNSETLGGAQGILIPLKEASLVDFQFAGKLGFYYVGLILVMLSLIITWGISRRRFGYNLLAIKDNETASEALGIPTNRYKLLATCLSGFLTALGGTFYAQYLMYISPETVFNLNLSIEIVLVVIVGGMGTLFGPVLGAFVLIPIGELTRAMIKEGAMGVHVIVYGIILIVFCLVLPGGLIPTLKMAVRSRLVKDA